MDLGLWPPRDRHRRLEGPGQAIAAELLAEGAQVVICSRNEAELDQAAAELGKASGAARLVALPLRRHRPRSGDRFMDDAAAALGGGIDILVNNAGGARPGPVRVADRRRLAGRLRGQAALPDPLHPGRPAPAAAKRRRPGHQHQRRLRPLPGPGVPRLVGQPGLLPQPGQGAVHRARARGRSWSTA